jgi:hypothetical protein
MFIVTVSQIFKKSKSGFAYTSEFWVTELHLTFCTISKFIAKKIWSHPLLKYEIEINHHCRKNLILSLVQVARLTAEVGGHGGLPPIGGIIPGGGGPRMGP